MSRLIDADNFGNRMYHEAFEKDSDMQKWDSGCWIRYKLFENVLREQPTVTPEPHWIPCSERLPNSNGCYLVWRPHFFWGEIGMPAICYFDGQNTWHDSYGVDFERILHPDDVTAWMPLPEPYRKEEQE